MSLVTELPLSLPSSSSTPCCLLLSSLLLRDAGCATILLVANMVSKFEGILTEVFDYSITPVYGGNKASGARMGKVVDLGKNLHNCLMR